MPPQKSSRNVLFKKWIKDLSAEEVYSIDGTIIFCQACQKNVPYGIFKKNVILVFRPI
jgi:hypothetical protein